MKSHYGEKSNKCNDQMYQEDQDQISGATYISDVVFFFRWTLAGIFLMGRGCPAGDKKSCPTHRSWYYGSKYPRMSYISYQKKISFKMDMGKRIGKRFKFPSSLAANKTTNFKISQEMDGGKLMFKVCQTFPFILRQGL